MKLTKKILFIYFCLLIGLINVNAEIDSQYIQSLSTDGYSVDVNAETGSAGAGLTMTLNIPEEVASGVTYFTYFVKNETDEKLNLNDYLVSESSDSCNLTSTKADIGKLNLLTSTKHVYVGDEWYLLNGYNYLYIVKQVYDSESGKYTCYVTDEPINVERPELPGINERYQIYVFSGNNEGDLLENKISSFPYYPHAALNNTTPIGGHELVTKIGVVNNSEVLNKFRDGEDDAFTSLLEYAKSSSGKTWNYSDSDSYKIDLADFTVTNGAYYYIYTTYSDSDGYCPDTCTQEIKTYRNLEGVSLVMGKNENLVTDLEWDGAPTTGEKPAATPKKNVKVTNPKTGATPLIIVFGTILVALLVGVYYKTNKTTNDGDAQ